LKEKRKSGLRVSGILLLVGTELDMFEGIDEFLEKLFLVIIFVCLIYFIFWILVIFGKRKLGIRISVILLVIGTMTLIFENINKDNFFTKSDALEDLKKYRIELKDDFEIVSIESKTKQYKNFKEFKLAISEADRERLINQIKTANNYCDCNQFDELKSKEIKIFIDEGIDTIITHNYRNSWHYIYDNHMVISKEHKLTFLRIMISKTENELIYFKNYRDWW